MQRRHFRSALVVISVVVVGCGSSHPAAVPPSDPTTTGISSVTSTTVATGIEHPDDPQVALLRLGAPGVMPDLVIGGDGFVYTAAPERGVTASPTTETAAPVSATDRLGRVVPAAVPPPNPPSAVVRRRLTAAGVQNLLAEAARLGLLQPPPSYPDPGVTDASTTYLVLTDAHGAYHHQAYALGVDPETGARARLERFVAELHDLGGLVGSDNLGPVEPYAPTTFDVAAGGFVSRPELRSWPAGVESTTGCRSLPVDRFPDGVPGVYVIGGPGSTDRVSVLPDLPGDECP